MKTYLTITLLILISYSGFAQTSPAPAETVLKEAYTKAAKENKKVILIFHASWCGWCKKMEASINDPVDSKIFDNNYVVTYVDVLERTGKENLENPGSLNLLKKYKAEKVGLPYWLILDAQGNELADSQIRPEGASLDSPGENLGCPAEEKEVAHFAKLLKATSNLTDADLAVISARFRKNEPAKPATIGTN
jgi:thiol-disulfide isomerase/thioredoxin